MLKIIIKILNYQKLCQFGLHFTAAYHIGKFNEQNKTSLFFLFKNLFMLEAYLNST